MAKSGIDTAKLNKDIADVLRDFDKLSKGMTKAKKRAMLKPAAEPIIKQAKTNLPKSSEVHHRWKDGQIVASYSPGNARRSIQVLPFKSSSVFVGPKIAKQGQGQGTFKGRTVDGWYAHFLEWGTVKFAGIGFLRRAYESTKGQVIGIIKGEVTKNVKAWQAKNWDNKGRR